MVRSLLRPVPGLAVVAVFAAVAATLLPGALLAQQKPKAPAPKPVEVTVHLTPTCGCCGFWADHLKAAGFSVKREVTTELEAVPVRQKVPARLRTCHTATIGKYVVEGHVPADVIKQLLKEAPNVVGIAVPGMPMGSPGMEGPSPRPYSIIAFKADGSTFEFARR